MRDEIKLKLLQESEAHPGVAAVNGSSAMLRMGSFRIVVEAYSGQVRPFIAHVYEIVAGQEKWRKGSGYSTSISGALAAGQRIVSTLELVVEKEVLHDLRAD